MIHIVGKDILTDDQRKKLIEDVQPLFVSGDQFDPNPDSFFPGKQTFPTLHLHPDFQWVFDIFKDRIRKKLGFDLKVMGAWINWTNGNKKDICWHDHHHFDYASVYYIKTPLPFFSNGTLFRDGLVKSPQNSFLLFPGHLEHTAPSSPFRFGRYTMSIDWDNK